MLNSIPAIVSGAGTALAGLAAAPKVFDIGLKVISLATESVQAVQKMKEDTPQVDAEKEAREAFVAGIELIDSTVDIKDDIEDWLKGDAATYIVKLVYSFHKTFVWKKA